MAHLLGFSRPLQNSYSCIASIDYITSTYSAIELLFLHLGRFIQDLQFWTSFEVGQVYVPNAFVQISSIMPQKRNPVPIEHMRHLASQTVGRAQAMLTIMHNTPFTDMNDSEGESQGFGLRRLRERRAAFSTCLRPLFPRLRINPERVRQNIRRSCITVTELADSLVRLEGLSFREAHEIAAEVAACRRRHRAAILRPTAIRPFRKPFNAAQAARRRSSRRSSPTIVSPENFVAVRDRFGGPAPKALASAIAGYNREIADIRSRMRETEKHARRIRAGPSIPFHRTSRRTLMATIELDSLVKRYGQTTVVHGIDLAIQDGEFVVLVGPSGCGKSTTLRMIAGLEEISGGQIRIDGRIVNDLQPKDRNIAMVFQNYAIYPHVTVADNIAFGLYRSKLSKSEKRQRVEQAAETLGLSHLLERRPSALSGGQRQRVAIGRAMVRDPAAFLFDEPLSNLDAQLRTQMRIEIKRLHHRLGTTSVFVTHDQVEAMTMADRIVVMRDGRILQVGTPLDLYEKPVDVFTARFIGSPTMNLLPANLRDGRADLSSGGSVRVPPSSTKTSEILVGVRPQDLVPTPADSSGLTVSGPVAVVETLGSETLVHIESEGQTLIGSAPGRLIPQIGEHLTLHAPAERLYYFDKVTEKALAAS